MLRGLHYQIKQPQGKLVRVVQGEVFDVAVALRQSSAIFGKYVGGILSAENTRQMGVAEGFVHGFVALSESAELSYKRRHTTRQNSNAVSPRMTQQFKLLGQSTRTRCTF